MPPGTPITHFPSLPVPAPAALSPTHSRRHIVSVYCIDLITWRPSWPPASSASRAWSCAGGGPPASCRCSPWRAEPAGGRTRPPPRSSSPPGASSARRGDACAAERERAGYGQRPATTDDKRMANDVTNVTSIYNVTTVFLRN